MKTCRTLILIAASCLMMAGAAFAHHSTSGLYDEANEVEIHGKVVEWRFINPHPSLTVEVIAEDGTVQLWDVNYGGAAVVHMKRQGYTRDTFKPGDEIIVHGPPAKAEGVYGILIEGGHPTWADGSQVVEGGSMF